MSAIRIRNNAAAGGRPPIVPGAPLSNKPPKRRGSPLPILLLLVLLGAAGYFGWKEYDRRHKARLAREAEYARLLAEQEARERADAEAAKREGKKKPTEAVAETEREAAPDAPKKKSATEIWQEREAGRKAMLEKVAEARRKPDARPLNGFAGIRFGEPLKDGSAVRWGTVLDGDAGDSVAKRGAAFAVYGPTLKKPFMSLGTNPLVWVTPKTRRPYRIEFSRALAPKPGLRHDAETTNLVAFLSNRFKGEPFATLPLDPDVAGCEYVFPMGSATVVVAESGDRLTFAVEREDLRAEALAESETLRTAEKQVAAEDGKALDSRRYPRRPADKSQYAGVRFKDETPRAFCGIVFASRPPESVSLVVPQKGPKGFFLDYEWAKCRPFRGFTRGRADVDSKRGGVFAVTLFSEGGSGGLDDADYFESVRTALSEHYKVTPEEKKVEGERFPQLVYRIGDLVVAFGPDARGGFQLRAENEVLATLAKEDAATGHRKSVRR